MITSNDYGLLYNSNNFIQLFNKISLALNSEWNYYKIKEYAEQFSWANILVNNSKIDSSMLVFGGSVT